MRISPLLTSALTLCRPSWTSARRHSSKQAHRQSRQRRRQNLRHQHQVEAQNKARSRAPSAGARPARPSAQKRVTFSHHRRGLTSERHTASFQLTPPSLWQESTPTCATLRGRRVWAALSAESQALRTWAAMGSTSLSAATTTSPTPSQLTPYASAQVSQPDRRQLHSSQQPQRRLGRWRLRHHSGRLPNGALRRHARLLQSHLDWLSAGARLEYLNHQVACERPHQARRMPRTLSHPPPCF